MRSLKKIKGYYPTDSEWKDLQVDSDGKVVLSNIPAHKTSHEDGGSDEIDIANLGTSTRARAYLSADQLNIINITWTKILLDAESYDVGNNFANYKFTAPITGYYLVIGSVTYFNLVANKYYFCAIWKNGVQVTVSVLHSSLDYYLTVPTIDILYLAAGDYLELYAYHESGINTIDIQGGVNITRLTINLLQL